MTDEEAIRIYNDMLKMFGTIPSPEHEPLRFKYYYKLYKYYSVTTSE